MKYITVVGIVMLIGLTGCTPRTNQGSNTSNNTPDASGNNEVTETRNLLEILKADSNFSKLVELLEASGVSDTITGPDQYTVFAPTNEALEQLPDYEALKAQPQELSEVILYHLMAGQLLIEDIKVLESAQVMNQDLVQISQVGNTTVVSGAEVTQSNIKASNGVIHAVNKVLVANDNQE